MRYYNVILLPCLSALITSGFSSSTSKKEMHMSTSSNKSIDQYVLSLSRSGKAKEAIAIYYNSWVNGKDQPTVRLMNNVISACARPFKPLYRDAFVIFHHGIENGLMPNVYTYGSLMSVCSKRGDVKKCVELIQDMKNYGLKPNSVIYSTAISACERTPSPNYRMALNLLNEGANNGDIDGFMNIIGYNAAISVLSKAGEWKVACRLLYEMEGAHECLSNEKFILHANTFIPKPDEVTYGTVMTACERAKEWGMVLELSKRMELEREDLELDGMGISSALHACQQLALGPESLKYLDKMKRIKNEGMNKRGLRKKMVLRGPDTVAYRLAISACSKDGMVNEAIELLHTMETYTGSLPDVLAYSAVIGGCADNGDYVKAFEVLSEMRKNRIHPNVIIYSTVLNACANACANMNSFKKEMWFEEDSNVCDVNIPMKLALSLLENMKREGGEAEPNIVSFNAVIRCCAESLDLQKAFFFIHELTERGLSPTIVTYGTLMTACERVGSVQDAERVFQKMYEDGVSPNEIIFGAAISCFRKASQPQRTLSLLEEMLEKNLNPNTAVYNTVIMAQIEAKNIFKATAVYNLCKSSKGSKPNRQTYNILVRGMVANSNPDLAEYYLNCMKLDGIKPDVELLTLIVSSYERSSEPIQALRLMERMREQGYNFYEMKLFDDAFKQGIRVISNVVGMKNSTNKT